MPTRGHHKEPFCSSSSMDSYSEEADTPKLECFLSQSKITLGGFLKNENLYKLFTLDLDNLS